MVREISKGSPGRSCCHLFAPEDTLRNLPGESTVLLAITERVGDALFRTPAIRLLVKAYPHIRFDALVFGKGAYEVIGRQPGLQEVHRLSDPNKIRKLSTNYDLLINTRSSNFRRYLSKTEVPLIQHRRFDRNLYKAEDLLRFAQVLLPRPAPFGENDRKYILPRNKTLIRRMRDLLHYRYGLDPHRDHLIGFHVGCASIGLYK